MPRPMLFATMKRIERSFVCSNICSKTEAAAADLVALTSADLFEEFRHHIPDDGAILGYGMPDEVYQLLDMVLCEEEALYT